MSIGIKAIEYFVPDKVLTNNDLSNIYKDWTAEKILSKTGIESRHIASDKECASDLAEMSSKKLFDSGIISPGEIDFIILATQSPDYILPTTSCIIQDKLGIPKNAGAFDINLGCSAYIYGLSIAKSLINTNVANNLLLITADTYSKYINPFDKSTRTIFGDAATSTLVSRNGHEILDFELGTDGSGKDILIIPAGGSREPCSVETSKEESYDGSLRSKNNLFMDGTEVFNFTIRVVPQNVSKTLVKHNLSIDDIDLFVFHQANKFMLDYLREKIKIPKEKFYINIHDIGNTVSSTIPIALKRAESEGRLKKGDKVMLTGFGVGLSWGSTIIKW